MSIGTFVTHVWLLCQMRANQHTKEKAVENVNNNSLWDFHSNKTQRSSALHAKLGCHNVRPIALVVGVCFDDICHNHQSVVLRCRTLKSNQVEHNAFYVDIGVWQKVRVVDLNLSRTRDKVRNFGKYFGITTHEKGKEHWNLRNRSAQSFRQN